MTKAVLKDGVFRPIGPLPSSWTDGTEVDIEKAADPNDGKGANGFDAFDAVAQAVANIPDEDEELLAAAIARIQRESRELAAKGML